MNFRKFELCELSEFREVANVLSLTHWGAQFYESLELGWDNLELSCQTHLHSHDDFFQPIVSSAKQHMCVCVCLERIRCIFDCFSIFQGSKFSWVCSVKVCFAPPSSLPLLQDFFV